jgi:hypothetical protein
MTNLLTTLIKPTGITRGQEIDLLYGLHKSLYTICAQLDDDSGVTDTDYEELCWAAIINCAMENSQGNAFRNFVSAEYFRDIRPNGMDVMTRHLLMYNFTNAFETLCEKLDADAGVTDETYEANCFTAKFLHMIRDPRGVTDLGNGSYYFSPSAGNTSEYIEWLYNTVDALETLAEQLDADGTVNDTDYEANSFTTYITLTVENRAGSTVGA